MTITLTHVQGRHSYYTFSGRDGSPFMTTMKGLALRQIAIEYPNASVRLVTEDRRGERMLPVTKGDLMKARG